MTAKSNRPCATHTNTVKNNSQPVKHRMIVQLPFSTVVQKLNQGLRQNMGVEDPGRSVGIIMFRLSFGYSFWQVANPDQSVGGVYIPTEASGQKVTEKQIVLAQFNKQLTVAYNSTSVFVLNQLRD
jgi:hypothetical protein